MFQVASSAVLVRVQQTQVYVEPMETVCLRVKTYYKSQGRELKSESIEKRGQGCVPMSMTVAPSFTMSACISPGIPADY